ncbi:hypothetical protein IQ03_00856 [Gemmobacter caeni]|uniref:Uncharacterized protein n=1 Tax=Gemmobacter caeni TaxID=589035 RepID=A0A2T6B6S3_9RHOB|nr:hypothetical protein C8N34_103275 [Gemmobacter caeni]TWJ03899.1 hypothetical protein IQ03_00856 [Gemmobacter caeni]
MRGLYIASLFPFKASQYDSDAAGRGARCGWALRAGARVIT